VNQYVVLDFEVPHFHILHRYELHTNFAFPVFIVLKGDTDFLTIGDTVNWRGGFGRDEAKPAKITGIEVCPLGSKYGTPVKQILWKKINDSTKTIVVNLDNGHWAYGVQISKLSTK
jgi:hypothetical protein